MKITLGRTTMSEFFSQLDGYAGVRYGDEHVTAADISEMLSEKFLFLRPAEFHIYYHDESGITSPVKYSLLWIYDTSDWDYVITMENYGPDGETVTTENEWDIARRAMRHHRNMRQAQLRRWRRRHPGRSAILAVDEEEIALEGTCSFWDMWNPTT